MRLILLLMMTMMQMQRKRKTYEAGDEIETWRKRWRRRKQMKAMKEKHVVLRKDANARHHENANGRQMRIRSRGKM